MLEAAADITTIGVLDSVASGAAARADGVRAKPASTSTLSLTINSCAMRLLLAGAPVVLQDRLRSFCPRPHRQSRPIERDCRLDLLADLGERTGHWQDQADLESILLCQGMVAGKRAAQAVTAKATAVKNARLCHPLCLREV